jgi:hypothetical protein
MSDATTVLNNPYADEPRLQRADILSRFQGISQLEYEDDLYTHHDGSVWTYLGDLDGKKSTRESAHFWVWVETGLQSEISNDGIAFEHSLNPLTGIPVEMGDEVGAPEGKRPRCDQAFEDIPSYVGVVRERRHWEIEAINAANDASDGSESAIARYRAAQRQMPGKRPKSYNPDEPF